MDLHVPAGDADFFDDEAEEGLFLVEVEGFDDREHALGEPGDAALELVVPGEFLAFGGEGVPPGGELLLAVVDVGRSSV